MERKSLVARKEVLKNKFEEIFETTIEEHLTTEGLAKFWSDETTYEQAGEMLDAAIVFNIIGNALCGLAIEVRIGDEPCKVKNGTPFKVYNKVDEEFIDDVFETAEAAEEYIRDRAMNTTHTCNDFDIVQVVK